MMAQLEDMNIPRQIILKGAMVINLENFMNDKPSWEREKDAPKSINRRWHGNGHSFNCELIDEILDSESLGYTKTLRRY